MKLFDAVVSFAPAAGISFATRLATLWVDTGLAHPHWQQQAETLGIVLGFLLTLVAVFIFSGSRKTRTSRTVAWVALGAFVLLLFACVYLRSLTADAQLQADIETYKSAWRYAYTSTIAFFIFAVSAVIVELLPSSLKSQ